MRESGSTVFWMSYAEASMPNAKQLTSFSAVSGIGWLLDTGLLATLVAGGLSPFWANLISAASAVTFVWLISRRRIFSMLNGTSHWMLYVRYMQWHAIAVPVASVLVAVFTWLLTDPATTVLGLFDDDQVAQASVVAAAAAKVVVTPISLMANYGYTRWLFERRGASPPRRNYATSEQ